MKKYRIYWIEHGIAREEFCATKEAKDEIAEYLKKKEIHFGVQII